jgi:catechol 2,3-dioxygenase-like lactoylglutathione lyase family enzyme
VLCAWIGCFAAAAQDALPAPGFHHLHLNSTNPDAAVDFYTRHFATTSRTTFAGEPALKMGKAYLLFTKVSAPPPTSPATAIWHFGWYVDDVRKRLAEYREQKDVTILPQYTGDEGRTVQISTDTYPGANGTLGRTKAEIAEAKARGIKPAGGVGVLYIQGPDGVIIENLANLPERFNHVHMWQEDPVCAVLWYRKHLNAPVSEAVAKRVGARTEADCKEARAEPSWPSLAEAGTIRVPSGGVMFDDVALSWYARQGDRPLVTTRGQVYDHIGLSVANLDAWMAKLRGEGVKFLEREYKLGEFRAVMIEGPSREAIELVEVR